jgi:hypothetical protein
MNENISKRESILREAINIVCSDRNLQYGEPEDNFSIIGELWSVYLNAKRVAPTDRIELTAKDASDMLILFKVARSVTATTPKRDTYVDIAGYAACAGEIIDKAVPSKPPLNIANKPIKTKLLCQECYWSLGHKCGTTEVCSVSCPMYQKQDEICKCTTIRYGDPCPYFEKWDGEQEKNNAL